MVVTWTTFNETKSEVEYGLLGGRLFEMSARGDAALFVDSGEEERKMYIHRVTLTDLKPAATYGGCRLNTTRFLSQHHATMSERLLFFLTHGSFQSTTAGVMTAGAMCSPSPL